ncbi:MAG: DNA polymerase I [Owenweeksia sp. TMED14]|nr:MAG: DNA polymerase I [Owenweeksia sp. TMED14]
MTPSRLYLLDAYALIFRAYFAFAKNPRVTSKGLETSAIYGFLLALLDVLEKYDPSHIAVVFDIGGSKARQDIFSDYKGNRDETPEGIKVAVPYIYKILEAMRIPALGVKGFEADDVIGTLAQKAEKSGYDVFMMTPDKDFGQLVTDKVKMLRPGRGGDPATILGPKEICEKWGISRVEQVVDVLGLMGDAADNIPGIPSVGAKTAAKLLEEYDSMEGILNNAEKIKGKLGEKVREFADQGRMSKVLAKIITDVPIDLNEDDLLRKVSDEIVLANLLDELEFRTLSRRLLKNKEKSVVSSPEASMSKMMTKSPSQKVSSLGQMDLFSSFESDENKISTESIEALIDNDYLLIDTLSVARLIGRKISDQNSFCFSIETRLTSDLKVELAGIAFSYSYHRAYYISLPKAKEESLDYIDIFKKILENKLTNKVAHNAKNDIEILLNYGLRVEGLVYDTMIMHYLMEPDQRHLKVKLFENYLSRPAEIINSNLVQSSKNVDEKTVEMSLKQTAQIKGKEVDLTWQLYHVFSPKLKELKMYTLYNDIEAPLIYVLSDMEVCGVSVDKKGLELYSDELGIDMTLLEKDVHHLAGRDFNLGSPKQLGEILFDELKIGKGKIKKTKTGQYATGEDVIEKLSGEHKIVKKLLEWRQLGKLKSTYVDALPLLIRDDTQRIHTTFNQAVAATGRLSSTNPNLQNIPVRTSKGKKVRKLFIPRNSEHIILSADYSQIELRVIASMSGDKAMIEAFMSGEDIHAATASKVFSIPLSEVTREQRSNAKTINFGIIYGVSAFGLSQQSNLSRTEAKEVIDSYFLTYPGIKEYIEDQIHVARDQGYVETLLGRRRYLGDINSLNRAVRGHAERNAINAPIQGTAADIMKLAMIGIDNRMKKDDFSSKMIIQVHDELVFDVRKTELEELRLLVVDEMERAYKLEVPLVVDTGIGENWLDAH